MDSRQRFLGAMQFGQIDRPPYFEEGVRQSVLDSWEIEGIRNLEDFVTFFGFDKREEIDPDLYPAVDVFSLSPDSRGLKKFSRSLEIDDARRLPEGWEERLTHWRKRTFPLFLRVHHGFFLTMGVGEWQSFEKVVYLLADYPDFVRRAMGIHGEFSAHFCDRILSQIQVDAAIFSEPIASVHGPLISPQTYRKIVLPAYQPIFNVLQQHGVEVVILRTYANPAALLKEAIEFGFNCLWAHERGHPDMDYAVIRQKFGLGLRLIGGLDLDILAEGRQAIRKHVFNTVPPLLEQGGYIPMLDGRVRANVPFDLYRYYREVLQDVVEGK